MGKMLIAHFDCFSGISGNMALGAVIDAGASVKQIREALTSLGDLGFKLTVRKAERGGMQGRHVKVSSLEKDSRHRGFRTIEKMIASSALPEPVKVSSTAVFHVLAQAESRVHGIGIDEVHFHEVGAVDALVDIVGTVMGLHLLGVDRLSCSELVVGWGEVECQHGTLPVPAPATLELLKGKPVVGGQAKGEMVAPTGAAIVAALAQDFGPMPAMQVLEVGHGLGDRKVPGRPNLVRLIVGQNPIQAETMVQIEATIDDMNPEFFDFLMERTLEAGALEGAIVPAYLKKNRPGHLVRLLAPQASLTEVTQALLNHSTTLGVRSHSVARTVLGREIITVKTPWGPVRVKKAMRPGGSARLHPEYDDLKALAQKNDLSLEQVEQSVLLQIGADSQNNDE